MLIIIKIQYSWKKEESTIVLHIFRLKTVYTLLFLRFYPITFLCNDTFSYQAIYLSKSNLLLISESLNVLQNQYQYNQTRNCYNHDQCWSKVVSCD